MPGSPFDAPCVLLTGFEPFGGESINPSQEIVRALDGATVAGHRVVGRVLPVSFAATLPMLEELVERHRPAVVIALGQAGGRSEISLERIAVNLVDARIADNDGLQPIDQPVVAGAPSAYFTSLPSKAIVARLRERGIPAGASLSAGSFVCNQVFFAIAHLVATRLPQARGGFVHVPWLPQQAVRHPGQPSMALATMIEGVCAAIECAIVLRDDLETSGGATH
ncbi:pyroglutamyl-peptidase I [Dokdonella sp.]|uniref:pyroglutamyl-peptidase I n=1 Tax=Dokdonella sp. TaxID=2291710 RepID=UPI002F3EC5A2